MHKLKKFDDWSINEKISWNKFLLAAGLTYLTLSNIKSYRQHKKLKKTYQLVNSEKSDPNPEEKEIIHDIKQEVIGMVKKSSTFNQVQKEWILDSIATIDFRVVPDKSEETAYMHDLMKNTKAKFMHISLPNDNAYTRAKFKYLYRTDFPEKENFIIILRKSLLERSHKTAIIHELYHYYEFLFEQAGGQSQNITKFLDRRINDTQYAKNKAARILYPSGELTQFDNDVVESLIQEIMNDLDYYQHGDELFARFKALKHDLVEQGYLKPGESLTKSHVKFYLIDREPKSRKSLEEIMRNEVMSNFYEEHIPFLILIDMDKLSEIDKVF